ncbi:hypothetical protein EYF80_019292 [Liparis tanakae]|uniref:Uncharacterized protein n=1 Tax=Liparis tanakae TaxID=230148 RepID=A0A4Z2HXY5_9TELE|nr:hypothetical protein EYF80_019292 [Liparis tanakae]
MSMTDLCEPRGDDGQASFDIKTGLIETFKSYNSINMDGTLMRKAMHADPENYVTSMAPGQYWTWGTQMRGVKGFCTLRPTAQRSELDVHNSFSTFGKRRRLQMSPQGEAAIINNDLYND